VSANAVPKASNAATTNTDCKILFNHRNASRMNHASLIGLALIKHGPHQQSRAM
jgi:hypothetical protein